MWCASSSLTVTPRTLICMRLSSRLTSAISASNPSGCAGLARRSSVGRGAGAAVRAQGCKTSTRPANSTRASCRHGISTRIRSSRPSTSRSPKTASAAFAAAGWIRTSSISRTPELSRTVRWSRWRIGRSRNLSRRPRNAVILREGRPSFTAPPSQRDQRADQLATPTRRSPEPPPRARTRDL